MAHIHRYFSDQMTNEPLQNDRVAQSAALEGCFTLEECELITSMSSSIQSIDGYVGTNEKASNKDGADWELQYKVRKSNVGFLPCNDQTQWIYDRILAIVNELNKQYRYELVGFEILQLASYSDGGHYDWHIDTGSGAESTRKLSITVQLTNPENYQGGELEFMSQPESLSRKQGTVIVFPSFLMHRVTPVTSGTRFSIVAWVCGPAFR